MSSSDLYECIFVLVFIGIFLTLCLASFSKRAKSLRRNLEVAERKLLAMSVKSEKWRGRAYVEAQRASRWFVVVQSMLETARNVSMEDTKTGGSSAAAGASSSRVEFSSVQLRLESEGKGLRDRIILTLEVPSDESGTLRVIKIGFTPIHRVFSAFYEKTYWSYGSDNPMETELDCFQRLGEKYLN